MQYLRKIDITRWYNQPDGDSDSVSDLRTDNHELSVWEVEDDGSNLDDMALALALTRNTPEQICCILLQPKEINDSEWNVQVTEQDGVTGYDKMKSRHKNFMLFSISEMGKLASYIHSLITWEKAERIKIYPEQDLINMLANKIKTKEIDAESLKEKHGKWRKEAIKIIEAENKSPK